MQALHDWTGGDYIEINNHLRNGKDVSIKTEITIKDMHMALDKCELPAMYVRRGTDTRYIDGLYGNSDWQKDHLLLDDKILTDKGFLATSPFLEGGLDGNVEIIYKIPEKAKGAYISEISHYHDEKEILFRDSSRIRIIRLEKIQTKYGVKYKIMARMLED